MTLVVDYQYWVHIQKLVDFFSKGLMETLTGFFIWRYAEWTKIDPTFTNQDV